MSTTKVRKERESSRENETRKRNVSVPRTSNLKTDGKSSKKSPLVAGSTVKNTAVKQVDSKASENGTVKIVEGVIKKSEKTTGSKVSSNSKSKVSTKEETHSTKMAVKKRDVINSSKIDEKPSNKSASKDVKSTGNTTHEKAKVQKSKKSSIVKEQYFPNKDLYKNAIHRASGKEETNVKATIKQKDDALAKIYTHQEIEKSSAKEKTKLNRNLSVDTTKEVKGREKRDDDERPKTQTKQKDEIILKDIMQREEEKQRYKTSIENDATLEKADTHNDESEYEDDFESYESDFEEYVTSTSSSVSNLPNTEDCSTTTEEVEQQNSNLPVKGVDILPSFNFAQSQSKLQQKTVHAKGVNRGKDILSMIKLDVCKIALLEMQPIAYRDTNRHGISSQTGDGYLNEETQTDRIETIVKYTQYPTDYSDTKVMEDSYERKQILKSRHLRNFVSKASFVIFTLLEESFRRYHEKRPMQRDDNYIKFNTSSLEILRNRPVTYVTHLKNYSTRILTVHGRSKIPSLASEDDLKSFLCIWNVSNESVPEKVMAVYGEATCCCFFLGAKNLVFGGMNDG